MKRKNYAYYPAPDPVTVKELFDTSTEKFANQIAYSYRAKPTGSKNSAPAVTVTVTYAQFRARVQAIATEALARNYQSTRIALIGKMSYSWICVYMAAMTSGIVLVPLDRDWDRKELCDTVKKSGCGAIFCDNDLTDKARYIAEAAGITARNVVIFDSPLDSSLDAFAQKGFDRLSVGDDRFDRNRTNPDALAMLVYTSGTTGKGKGVMLSQHNVLSNVYGGLSLIRMGSKTIATLPPHHTYGSTVGIIGPFCVGAHTYISSGIRYFMQELAREKPDFLVLVPLFVETFYHKIWSLAAKAGKTEPLRQAIRVTDALRHVRIDLRRALFGKSILSAFGGRLNLIICGGAPLSQEVRQCFESFGIQILNGYGITECAPLISVNRPAYIGKDSVGVPMPRVTVHIDRPNEFGEGEICVKGPNVMLGYYHDEAATREAFDEDGFFHTGDIGKYENDLVYITGRAKNLIILSNGKNVYPEEIEAALSTIPGVADVVVYEGISTRGPGNNAIVAEFYPDMTYLEEHHTLNTSSSNSGNSSGIDTDALYEYFSRFVSDYNRTAIAYKKVSLVKIRTQEFPKNTLRKILRFKIDRRID